MKVLCAMTSDEEINELNQLRIDDLNVTQQQLYDNYDENIKMIDEQYEFLKDRFTKDPEKAEAIMEIMSFMIDGKDK